MFPVKILLIDRHAVFTDGVASLLRLQSEFIVVATATNSEGGLREARVRRLDVIIVGLESRGARGLITIKRLRASCPSTGIIALSLHDHASYQRAALSSGADDFVSKLRVVEDLVPAIQRVVQFRSAVSD
jgi:DNA-binding NarL/FixJ family response regulator